MELHIRSNAKVVTADGQEAGRVDRVVLAPQTNEVTHLVVRKGLLFGQDKVVPVDQIQSATDEAIGLRLTADKLADLLPFEETHYIPIEDDSRAGEPGSIALPRPAGLYWYPPVAAGLPVLEPYDAVAASTGYVAETERNVPEGTVALKKGARVVAADGVEVGGIDEVLTDSTSGQATDFVIEQGFLFKERKRVPVGWIRSVAEDEAKLAVESRLLERLSSYNGK
jgi:uncharacterized protein YrrD